MPGLLRRDVPLTPEPFSFADLERERAELHAAAHAAAAEITAAARAQALQIVQEQARAGYQRGYAAGREAGHAAAVAAARDQALAEQRTAFEQLQTALTQTLRAFEQRKHALLAAAESEVITLALEIARRVCKHVAETDPNVARDNMRAALALARHEADAILEVAPQDEANLRAALPALLAEIEAQTHVELRAADDVAPGGARLRGRTGSIDATIATQLDRVAAALCAAPAAEAEE